MVYPCIISIDISTKCVHLLRLQLSFRLILLSFEIAITNCVTLCIMRNRCCHWEFRHFCNNTVSISLCYFKWIQYVWCKFWNGTKMLFSFKIFLVKFLITHNTYAKLQVVLSCYTQYQMYKIIETSQVILFFVFEAGMGDDS